MSARFRGSYYEATAQRAAAHAPLAGASRFDVGIVGGGYTGLSSALHLAQRGYRVALLEAERIGHGASGRNGGQVITGQRVDQETLEGNYGPLRANALWALAEEAKTLVRDLIHVNAIACDVVGGHVTAAAKARHADDLKRYAAYLEGHYQYGHGRFVEKADMPTLVATQRYFGAYYDTDSFHLHPLNYALGLARAAQAAGATIFEMTRVTKIERGETLRLHTADGAIECKFGIIGCNAYLDGLEREIEAKVLPISNYIVATEPLGDVRAAALIPSRAAVADTKFVLDYYRMSADGRLIFGGGETYGAPPQDIAAFVRPYVERTFPQLKGTAIDYAWGGQLAITLPRMPHVGRLTPNLYFAQGYSGQGVATATLTGKLMAQAIAGQAEKFDVFAGLEIPALPGGAMLRRPLLTLGMIWYALRDRLP